MKIRQIQGISFLTLFLFTVFFSLRGFDTRSGPEVFSVTSPLGGIFTANGFAAEDPKVNLIGVVIRAQLDSSWWRTSRFQFLTSACLMSLSIEDQEVDLSALSHGQRCDQLNGITLDLKKYLHSGRNSVRATLDTLPTHYEFSIHRIHQIWEEILALLLQTTLLGLCFVFFLRFVRARGFTEHRIKTVAFCLVSLLSVWLFLDRLSIPALPIWDENAYITDAQKFMDHTYYMQLHPPLGKLILAWSGQLFGAGTIYPQMLETDYLKDFPAGFDFGSYRVLPSLCAGLGMILFYLSSLLITESVWMAIAMVLLYGLETGMLLHFRAAQLDGPFQFFSLLAIAVFLWAWRAKSQAQRSSRLILLGLAIAATCATKLSGIYLLPLIPIILFQTGKIKKENGKDFLRLFLSGMALYLLIWAIHIERPTHLNSKLSKGGWYESTQDPLHSSYSRQLIDQLKFFSIYNAGVPKLDFRKADENGSPFVLWLMGAKGINYRWDRVGPWTSYLQFQVNPATYLVGFLGLLLSLVYFLAPLFVGASAPPTKHFKKGETLLILTLLYGAYSFLLLNAGRVLFLYNYIPAFTVSLLIFAAVWPLVGKIKPEKKEEILLVAAATAVIFYFYFAPFVYHLPLLDYEVGNRAWIPHWDLHCASCPRVFPWLGN